MEEGGNGEERGSGRRKMKMMEIRNYYGVVRKVAWRGFKGEIDGEEEEESNGNNGGQAVA